MECPHCDNETGKEPIGFGVFCPACKGYIPPAKRFSVVEDNELKLKLWQQKVRDIIRTKIQQTEKQNGD